MKNPLPKKKNETCKRPQQNQKNQKPQPNHMVFIAFFFHSLLVLHYRKQNAFSQKKKDADNRTENAGLGKP
jgi:hypothetical protein